MECRIFVCYFLFATSQVLAVTNLRMGFSMFYNTILSELCSAVAVVVAKDIRYNSFLCPVGPSNKPELNIIYTNKSSSRLLG